jgi:hypothetical protein
MTIYLIQKLIDDCAWITLEAFKNKSDANKRLWQLTKKYTLKNSYRCKFHFKIEPMKLN